MPDYSMRWNLLRESSKLDLPMDKKKSGFTNGKN